LLLFFVTTIVKHIKGAHSYHVCWALVLVTGKYTYHNRSSFFGKGSNFSLHHPVHTKNRDSSVGIALGYGLDNRGSRVRFPGGLEIFLFTTASRTALGPTQPPVQWIPRALSLGVKLTIHLRLVPRSKNEWSYTSIPQYSFMAWCSVKAQGQLYLLPCTYVLSNVFRSLAWGNHSAKLTTHPHLVSRLRMNGILS
jgi:hypothetical protein